MTSTLSAKDLKARIKAERSERKRIILEVLSENRGRFKTKTALERLKAAGLYANGGLADQWVRYYRDGGE